MAKKETKKKDFEEKLIAYHPRFLQTVKEVYPLAVLGSLCIAITVFAQTYPEAQAYATTAASLFLVAYVSSFVHKIVPTSGTAFFSYVATALATLFLFLVIMEFVKVFPMVSKTLGSIPAMFGLLMFSYFYLLMGMFVSKQRKSRIFLICGAVSISLGLLFIVVGTIGFIDYFLGTRYVTQISEGTGLTIEVLIVGLFVSFMIVIILALWEVRSRKKLVR